MSENSISFEKIEKVYKFSLLVKNEEIYASKYIKKYETENSYIWLINPNEIELDISKIEKLDNIKNYVHDIDGIWACIIKNKSGKGIRAISSIHNELPWYYSAELKGIIANNLFLVTDNLKKLELNFRAVSSFLAFDFCYGGETFLNGINKSYGGDILYISNDAIKVVGCDLQKWLGFDESISDRNLVLEAFLRSVEKSLDGSNPQISLTGGADSRALLAAALNSSKDFSLMTGTSSTVDKRDIVVADLIAKMINKEHYKIDASNVNAGKTEDILKEVAISTNFEFTPKNWLIFYKEYAFDKENLIHVSRIKGYRGEFFKGFYKGLGGSIDSYLNRHSFFLNNKYKNQVYELIQDRYSFYKNLSGLYVDDLFYHRERDNFWVSCNIKTHINYCKIITPFSDSKLLGLGYRFVGGIRNSKLHETSFKLLPSKIQKIPTSSGQINRIYNHYIKKIKRQPKHSYYLDPGFIQDNISYELLNEIVPQKTIELLLSQYNLKGLNSDIVHKLFAVSYFYNYLNNFNKELILKNN